MKEKINPIIKIWHFFTLKTYHNNLLTTGGATYLTVVSFIMILAAISEGFAWGFLGSAFTPESPLIGWLCVGGFVFLLMWFFDRSLASADLLKEEHEKTLNGEEDQDKISPKRLFFKYSQFVIRLGIVLLSLYVTAPFLTQLVFKADIENKMLEQYKDNVVLARENGLKVRDTKISELERLVNNTNNKLQHEIGGKAGTGYGYGSVAKSIERQLQTIQSDLDIARNERNTFLTTFDKAVDRGNEEELKKYGITIAKDSPIFRQKAIDEFESEPAFKKVEFAVDMFLVILGVILISAKLMQPRTLQMYFSSRLQEKWVLYKLETFDKYLPEQERSSLLLKTNQSIPEEFESIIVQYAKGQRERKQQEILLIQEKERAERDKQQQLLLEEQRKLEKERQKTEKHDKHDAELRQAEKIHLERLAKEKSELEMREKTRVFYETQILKSLGEVEEAEQEYLANFSGKISEYENLEKQLITELHEIERTYKNHEDNVDARNKRIVTAEQELGEMQQLASQLQRPQETHTIESLRSFTTAESAVVEQKSYIKNIKTSLLSFETDQKYFNENMNRIRQQLSKTQNQLTDLKAPLEIITSARSKIEARKMMLLGEEGLIDTPYERYQEEELPIIVDKLKKQLSTHAPTYMS
ncbi:DUF4407 domain-containing protein [Acinetobacter terrestris]|uniref:DUF4407 domain-containing protein n=1 Tax=Acinetobacter terrestris TaxID=2529843 RepID=UPI0010393BEC|nr:DUF4407 domain-containing protein [Acinetobacter terrestris]TCB53179.1 DUF4407 domain-containing protein [Acinetobacter terrestris]